VLHTVVSSSLTLSVCIPGNARAGHVAAVLRPDSGEELGFDPEDQIPTVDPVFCGLDLFVDQPSQQVSAGNSPANQITPRHPSQSAPWSTESKLVFEFEFKCQILCRSCKINIKSSLGPKLANDIPLESLGNLESSSTIISYILWVQFENIFKLNQTCLQAC
jgi:hypothetical protein